MPTSVCPCPPRPEPSNQHKSAANQHCTRANAQTTCFLALHLADLTLLLPFLTAQPQGGHNGVLEFWDTEEMSLLNTGEHFMAQEIAWDPTGRYVATIVNAAAAMENGFQIWSFSGQPLYK